MATNRKFAKGSPLSLAVASPTKSGDPVAIGGLVGVALTDYSSVSGEATIDLEGVFDLSVKGVDDNGNADLAIGDPVYFEDGATPPLSGDSSGIFFGYLLETVASGATSTVMVRIASSGGGGGGSSALSAPFVSAETTGTGSNQNIAHGLGAVPSRVLVVLTEFLSNQSIDIAEGTHTTTNVVVNVASGVKFKVAAWK